MSMRRFEYRRATDSAQAFELIAEAVDGAALLAGGTDLLALHKDGVLHRSRLVDIKRLGDLDDTVRVVDDQLVIGALATLADLAHDGSPAAQWALLGQAARSAATPQLRAMATVAGNLLQRPRCWYFRNPAFHCWLAGGDGCPARDGRNERHAIFPGAESSPCCAVHPSDLAPCLVALDAQVRLRAPDGAERLVDVAELFRAPTPDRRTETVLNGELITAVYLPLPAEGSRTAYRKAMSRRSWSFALSAAAVHLNVRGDRITDARVVLGGVAGVPWRAHQAESALRDQAPSDQVLDRAARLAVVDAEPLAHNAYKVPLTRGMVARALRSATG